MKLLCSMNSKAILGLCFSLIWCVLASPGLARILVFVAHSKAHGVMKGYIDHDRVCFDNGLVRLMFSAPDYSQVTLINDESKVFLKESFDAWLVRHHNFKSLPCKTKSL